jgi:CheY-like chemotaxis protein
MLRALVGEQVTVKRELQDDLPPVNADPGMMEQILVNLAVNARDAMPRGGTLTITTSFAQVDEGCLTRHPEAKAGDYVCLSVSDTGHGMDESTLSRIFEPFFTTKEKGKGTGLGLATVYGIVRQHCGWVEAESAVDQGTTFKVLIPACARGAAKRGTERPANVPGGDETILIVEDEPALRELVQEILEKKGYRILSAASGVQALKVWAERRDAIELLFTDMVMPEGVSGRELADRLRQDRPELKVVYTSGYSLDVVNSEFAEREGTTFLQKPYDPEMLAQTVRDCLNC